MRMSISLELAYLALSDVHRYFHGRFQPLPDWCNPLPADLWRALYRLLRLPLDNVTVLLVNGNHIGPPLVLEIAYDGGVELVGSWLTDLFAL
jgi:hypothetical protein